MHTTAIVQPIAPRYVTTQLGSTLRITLPSRKHWLTIIPAALFVVICAIVVVGVGGVGGAALLAQIIARPETLVEALFPLGLFTIWLGFFSFGGLTALYTVLWNLAGREVIDVSRQSIRLARVIPGWSRTRDYLAEHIRDLRVSPHFIPRFYRHQMSLFSLGDGQGQLAFDYGARTIRFADADEAEVKMILAEIRPRFPQYAPALDTVTGQPADYGARAP